MKNQKFQIQNELGEIKEAEIMTVVKLDGKRYAVYTIANEDDTVNVYASYVEKDKNGFDVLVDIENKEDKKKITDYIKKTTI